ncbi:MAG: hypothetical protein LJE74_09600, partial [Proteobacteria bacterium]|nr:hypothetical protein [Pseudomonadota bacterium]
LKSKLNSDSRCNIEQRRDIPFAFFCPEFTPQLAEPKHMRVPARPVAKPGVESSPSFRKADEPA